MIKGIIRYICLCSQPEVESKERGEAPKNKIVENSENHSDYGYEKHKYQDLNLSEREESKDQSDETKIEKESLVQAEEKAQENIQPESYKETAEIKFVSMPDHVDSKEYVIDSPLFGKIATFSNESNHLMDNSETTNEKKDTKKASSHRKQHKSGIKPANFK